MSNTVNLGTCWSTGTDNDLTMPARMATGFRCVAEAVLRRWATSRVELIDDPNYGTNAADSISDDLSPRDIAYLQQQLAAEAQKDERVLKAVVTVTLTTAGLLTIVGALSTAAGPFKMVVAVSQVTTQLLLVQ